MCPEDDDGGCVIVDEITPNYSEDDQELEVGGLSADTVYTAIISSTVQGNPIQSTETLRLQSLY